MNYKKAVAAFLAGAMVLGAVPVYAKGDDVTLSVSIWDSNQEPGIKQIMDDFTKETGIKTEISVIKCVKNQELNLYIERIIAVFHRAEKEKYLGINVVVKE